eukprot:8255964-Pyramimonas_sp.AAC.1
MPWQALSVENPLSAAHLKRALWRMESPRVNPSRMGCRESALHRRLSNPCLWRIDSPQLILAGHCGELNLHVTTLTG